MKKHMSINSLNAALLALALGTGNALAADGTWIDAAGSWGDATKWTGGIPDVAGATAGFQASLASGNRTVTLDGNRTIGILNLGFSSNARGLVPLRRRPKQAGEPARAQARLTASADR